MRTLYNAALLPLRAAAFVFGVWPRGSPEATLERDQRLARELPRVAPGGVWIHGASVGEARLVGALARELRRRRPARVLVVSAVTPTGRAQLPASPAVDGSFFLPLDFPSVQRRAFDALAPALVVLIETELWPNMIAEAASRGIPVVVVNARLAPERLARYRRLRPLYAPLLAGLSGVGASGADEAARFVSLGVRPDVVRVTGSLKFELDPPSIDAAALRERFGIDPSRPVVAAGSTGPGEDRLVLDAFDEVRRLRSGSLLVLAPRHPERFDPAEIEAKRRGLAVARVSRAESAAGADVLLVDSIGQLASLYAVSAAAFVGGTLVPVGGHNLLEPLAAGAPVLFGPHTGHVAEMAQTLLRSGAGERVADAPTLAEAWTRLLGDPAERARRVAIGSSLLAAHRGALAATVDLVLDALDRGTPGARR
jgi:3-deoxy-D-manno-octulosonic-acid transferase